jgi:hypothetical protein
MSRKILTGVLDSISRGYTISSSALFDRWTTASPGYMTRTFGTPTAQNIFTVSTWVKRGVSQTVNGDSATNSGAAYDIMDCGGSGFNNQIWFYDTLNMYGGEFFFTTKALFMDIAAWYHIVIACNANLSGTNKIKVYVNGSEVTDFDTDLRQNFPGTSGKWNNAVLHSIGGGAPQTNFFDGYMADTYFIDGQALDASYFGQFSSTTGAWIPKKYSGSYGNNGFYLDYSNSSNLGADYSGRNNNFTKNGDVYKTTDGPQPSSINSSLGNYAVWNTQTPYYSIAYKGNTRVSCTSGSSLPSTIFVNSGKWYWEVKWVGGTNPRIGVCSEAGIGQDLGGTANTWCRLNSPSRIYNNGTTTSFGTDLALNDIIMIAMDVDAGKIWYGKNGSWEGSGNPSAGTNAAQTFTANLSMSPAVSSGGGTPVFEANFGSFGFAYTAPTNFKALNTSNITNPSVLLPNRYYDAVQYAGTSNASTAVGGLNFSPDLVWIKNKSLYVDGQSNNMLFDVLRGATNYLNTDKTNTQQTLSTSLTSFNQNGFTPGTATRTNETNSNYIAWNWDAGSSTLTNTDGTVTSTVRVNQTAGFSIVQYNTGNNLNAYTVGHGLGKAPKFIMIKGGYTTDNYNWDIYHTSLGPTKRLKINSTDMPETQGGPWDNTTPSSTLIYQNNQNNFWYGTNRNNIAYCWTDIDGYSKFGSYTGTSSANGPFVHLGFKPAWLLIKRTDTGGDYWNLMDSKRDTYNEGGSNTDRMYPNSINYNETGVRIDFLSNGFKIRDTNSNNNGTNMTYVYAAFAENPFKYSVAR